MHRTARLAIAALLVALVGVTVAVLPAGGASSVVLGSSAFAGASGEGWGTSRPTKIYNGGDLVVLC